MSDNGHSPHYFVSLQRQYHGSNLFYQIAQCDADQLTRAWNAVQWLVNRDLDYAANANGVGFSKSDTKIGHKLARWPLAVVHQSEMLAIMLLKLARKYRRQLPPEYIVDQPSLPNFDI